MEIGLSVAKYNFQGWWVWKCGVSLLNPIYLIFSLNPCSYKTERLVLYLMNIY